MGRTEMRSNSYEEFESLLETVDQLITIHGRLQQGRGRRHQQDAIHRAGVVLTVAAWQTYVEKVILEGFSRVRDQATAPVGGVLPPPWAVSGIGLRGAVIKKSVSDFNTPNSENVQRILCEAFDFDPWPNWKWHAGPRKWNSNKVCKRTNEWIKIRHSIVHSVKLPEEYDWIKANNGSPRLTLVLLKDCRRHFQFLASVTDVAFWRHLRDNYQIYLD